MSSTAKYRFRRTDGNKEMEINDEDIYCTS